MVKHGAPNAECIAEMHRRHRGQGVDVLPLHPNTLPVVMADAIEKPILLWEEARRHTWVEDEDGEGHQIRKSHRSADDCECVERGGNVVPPRNKTRTSQLPASSTFERRFIPDRPRNMDQRIRPVQHSKESLMPMHEPLLHISLVHRPQKAQPRKLLELQYSKSVAHGNIPNARFRKDALREELCTAVECICDDPVEHLHQKGEFLHNPAVVVVRELGGIGREERGPTTSPPPGGILHGYHGIYRQVIDAVVGDHPLSRQEIIGRARRIRVVVKQPVL